MHRLQPLCGIGKVRIRRCAVHHGPRETGNCGWHRHRFASLCALLDRLFYSSSSLLRYKPAACVAVCRRGGASATFDRLNKYFTITDMLVVGSQYWNSVHGRLPGEALQDAEGLQTMRTLGNNMAWVLKSLKTAEASRCRKRSRKS